MAGSRAGPSSAAPTPARRSNRLASIPREGAPSIAVSTATPAGTAARRKAALTKVKTRPSNAYGATGRVEDAQDLTISTTGFTQTFGDQRENAVVRDEEVHVEVASSAPAPIPQPRGALGTRRVDASLNEDRLSSSVHHSDEDDSDSDSPSVGNTSKSFGIMHEAGMTAARAPRLNGNVRPGPISGAFRAAPQPRLQQPALAPVPPPRLPQAPPRLPQAPPHRPQAPAATPGDHAIPPVFHENISSAENRLFREKWATLILAFLAALAFLVISMMGIHKLARTPLVDHNRVYRDYDNWNLSMIDALAMRSEFIAQGITHHLCPNTRKQPWADREGRTIIDEGYVPVFQRTNDLQTKVEAHENALSQVQDGLASLEEFLPNLVTVVNHGNKRYEITDEFWRALISKLQSEGMSDGVWLDFVSKNREAVMQTLTEAVKEQLAEIGDPVRLESLAMANLVANAELSLRKVNFFSTGLGARVDPFATSTTFADKDGSAVYQKLFSARHARPPITALKSWEEPGDCWCAAPDTGGKGLAQLAVQLGQPMIPRQVTVENLPREASLDAETAPRVMELWAQTSGVASAAGCGPGLDGWVCLGRFSYNLEAMNHVQTFNLDVIVAKPITKTILRVVENWGGDHTCLYRLRLHGDAAPSE
ncbi:hypothetical protein K491DRAFT_218314 [Lophiostoma macrostomum CBS 122681]|uniref:SUN domain-containing protein n=1 Tax=Lophiostoma macrostomum CBS 122681 TaxID=1314788 RepID=A0A6A6THK6_9PLEO|nr:hypothetical protein K491DRAFT_218314 [Lophiostoma macrostomum CBS 122681]